MRIKKPFNSKFLISCELEWPASNKEQSLSAAPMKVLICDALPSDGLSYFVSELKQPLPSCLSSSSIARLIAFNFPISSPTSESVQSKRRQRTSCCTWRINPKTTSVCAVAHKWHQNKAGWHRVQKYPAHKIPHLNLESRCREQELDAAAYVCFPLRFPPNYWLRAVRMGGCGGSRKCWSNSKTKLLLLFGERGRI